MNDSEDYKFKMEVYLDEPEKINEYNSEAQGNISTRPKRNTTSKRPEPKKRSREISDSENDDMEESDAMQRVRLLEKQLRSCQKNMSSMSRELNEMRDENLALKENNVKYQVFILNFPAIFLIF